MIKPYQKLIPIIIGISSIWACTKEKTPEIKPTQPLTLSERVAGHYKVFDTVGNYLYAMNIIHIHTDSNNIDSLRFENFDGNFTFTVKQENQNPSNYPNYIRIGTHPLLYDLNSKRWKLGSAAYQYYNSFHNDTLPLRFQKTNINYYISDVTPYYACDCKQIAVKQH